MINVPMPSARARRVKQLAQPIPNRWLTADGWRLSALPSFAFPALSVGHLVLSAMHIQAIDFVQRLCEHPRCSGALLAETWALPRLFSQKPSR